MSKGELQNQKAFTLLEILSVVVLLSLFFVVVVSAFQSHDNARHIAAGDILASHIRYVQMRSMDSATRWGIEYNGVENAYWMFREDAAQKRRPFPGEAQDVVPLDPDITILPGSFTLRFDAWGRPLTRLPFTGDGPMILSVSMNGKDLPLTVFADTGFVQWQP